MFQFFFSFLFHSRCSRTKYYFIRSKGRRNSKAYDNKRTRRMLEEERDAHQPTISRERSINHPVLFTCKLQPPSFANVSIQPFAPIPPPSISNLYIIHGNEPDSPKLWEFISARTPRKSVCRNRRSDRVHPANRYLATETRRGESRESLRRSAPPFVLGFQWRFFS